MKDTETDRFGSFFKRVEIERAALKIVNQAFPSYKLHGLTEAAIKSWDEQNSAIAPQCCMEIATILLTLSKRIDALADQSRVVFSGETMRLLGSHQLLTELENFCSRQKCT
jgi:hypothetical protein